MSVQHTPGPWQCNDGVTITAQARTIAEQAQRISVLSLCLHQALVHAPQFVRTQVAERLIEVGLERQP